MAESSNNFESAADAADQNVASFEQEKTLLSRFQSTLHHQPSLVPLIVLVRLSAAIDR